MNRSPNTEQTPSTVSVGPLYRTPVFTRVLLLIVITVGATLSACMPDILTASIAACVTGGIFAFDYVLTFSPAAVFVTVPAYLIAFAVTQSFRTSLGVLLFLPVGAALSLCMLKRARKTSAVISSAVAALIGAGVFFSIDYIATHGTISVDSLLLSYDSAFEAVRETLLLATQKTIEAAVLQNPAFAEYATDAYVASVVNASVDAMKLSMPAVVIVIAQLIGFFAVSAYIFFVRLFRCDALLPQNYRIMLSPITAVVFIVSYLINLFSVGSTTSLVGVAAGNIATVLMPGLFLLGLRSFVRRAKNPRRRRSFILTCVVLGLLVFTSPIYAFLFIVVDGLGEIFFDERLPF